MDLKDFLVFSSISRYFHFVLARSDSQRPRSLSPPHHRDDKKTHAQNVPKARLDGAVDKASHNLVELRAKLLHSEFPPVSCSSRVFVPII